jgi:kynureninase
LAPLMLPLLVLLLTSCGSIGRAIKPDTACLAFKPIYVSKSDVLTDGTARAILAHNETGAKKCGWKAR